MTTKTHSISDLLNVVKGRVDPPACDQTLCVEMIEAVDGKAHGIWTVDETFINGNGVAMGGFVAGALDIVMAYAIASKIETTHKGFASIDLDTTFHRPAVKGKAMIEAKVVRCGRSIAYLEANVTQNDQLIANGVSSIFIFN